MATDLTTIDRPATDCWTLVSTASARAVLDRAFDTTATFTAADIALAQQIAGLTPPSAPADDNYVRRSIGALAGAMPSQAMSNAGGQLKLKTYQTMLAGCDERALAYACRRCLDELDWMPTVHQIKERIAAWVSPEQAAIGRARAILRSGRRAVEGDDGAADPAEVAALRARLETAAGSIIRPRSVPVPFDQAGPLQPHQMRVPNKGDYERLFGIDPETERAKAAQAEAAEQERDRDLLWEAYQQQAAIGREAA